MILNTLDIKNISQIILNAVDNSESSLVTESLELIVKNGVLFLNVTNREYYAKVKFNLGTNEDFHATVNANLFLKLISKITTEQIEFNIDSNNLIIKGNGTYKIPLIFEGEQLLTLPEINVENVTSELNIDSNILMSILQFNSRQLSTGFIAKPIQRLFYIDDCGAITFTSGACINTFKLDMPIKLLVPQKIVNLFKLFKGKEVKLIVGHSTFENSSLTQTRIKFESDNIELTAILLADDNRIDSVPVSAIRNSLSENYPYSVVMNVDTLLSSISRLMLFVNTSTELFASCKFTFTNDKLEITDLTGENKEIISYDNESHINGTYNASIDLIDLDNILNGYSSSHITFKFGNNKSILICNGDIVNVIPELIE